MLESDTTPNVPSSWMDEWRRSYRTASELCELALIKPQDKEMYEPLLRQYRFVLPRYYAGLIDPTNPNCPIRKQAIPDLCELQKTTGYKHDPLCDLHHKKTGPLTHRFADRAVIHLTPNCPMYCRYCFRKNLFDDQSDSLFNGQIEAALRYITSHPEITEVIFSGGDPLMANDTTIGTLLDQLNRLSHIKRLRLHTRVPVTFPVRVTKPLTKALTQSTKPIIVVVHFNHPKEFTNESFVACQLLQQVSSHLLNQTVLLNQVNSDTKVLVELSEKLFDFGILPYYLHHPDPAQGTAHFSVSIEEGKKIFHELRSQLPGYLVPRYVIDQSGHPYKQCVVEL